MPNKLTKEELNNVVYVSMADYASRVDEIEDIQGKVDFTIHYLLSQERALADERDFDFAEAVYLAKLKITQAVAKAKKDLDETSFSLNPKNSVKLDLVGQEFMASPVECLKKEANRRLHEYESKANLSPEEEMKKTEMRLDVANLSRKSDAELSKFEATAKARVARTTFAINDYLGENKTGKQLFEEIKPSFFGRMFGNYSHQWSNLETVYKAFNNPSHVLYGDEASLNKAALDYLHHKVPNYKLGDPLDQTILSAFDKKELGRIAFSISIATSYKNNLANERDYAAMVGEAKDHFLNPHKDEKQNQGEEVKNEQVPAKENDLNNEEPKVESNVDEDINALDVSEELDEATKEKQEFLKGAAEEEKAKGLKDDGEEMDLDLENEFIIKSDDDDEVYALDDPFEGVDDKDVIRYANDHLDDSDIIEPAKENLDQKKFQEEIKEDLEDDGEEIKIDTTKQVARAKEWDKYIQSNRGENFVDDSDYAID